VATATTSTIPGTVTDKSRRKYRPADELWLAIQCSPRISETLLPIDASDFSGVGSLDHGRFSRVFVLTFLGVFQWKRGEGWRKLTGEPDQQFSNALISSSPAEN